MLIPSKYLVPEGKEVEEGTVVKTCKYCGRKFAIPANEAAQYEKATVCDDQACIEKSNQEAAALASSLMKNPGSTEAANAVKTAVGN